MEIFTTNETIGNKMNIIVLGDSHVGKTTLLQNYTNLKLNNDTLGNPQKTIGLNIHVKKILHEQSLVITNFYDFSGDPEYKQDLDIFLKLLLTSNDEFIGEFPIHAIFLIFDINLKRTLESLKSWLIWLQKKLVEIGESQGKSSKVICENIRKKIKKIPVFLFGNKIDKLTKQVGLLKMSELDQREKKVNKDFDRIIGKITDFLRRKFAFVDFDNLVFLSKNMDKETNDCIDEIIFAAFDFYCPEAGLYSKIDIEAYTLDRFIGWDNLESYGGGFGFLNFLSNIFNNGRSNNFKDRDNVALPLYSN